MPGLTISKILTIVIGLVAVIVIGAVITITVFKANPVEAITNLFGSTHDYVIGPIPFINNDRTVTLTWKTNENAIDFIVYEMHQEKAELTPSENNYNPSSTKPAKPKKEDGDWTWKSDKLTAGSHFFLVVPVVNGQEIRGDLKETNGNFYDDEYVELYNDNAGDCGVDDCGVLHCKEEFVTRSIDYFTSKTDVKKEQLLSSFKKKHPSATCLDKSNLDFEGCLSKEEINELYYTIINFELDFWSKQFEEHNMEKNEENMLVLFKNNPGLKDSQNPEICRANLKEKLGELAFSNLNEVLK